uniref:CHAD domain-containing protein n=1 Tax=Pseudacidovorax intermedius TaxID=433924 RepID=UPI0005B98FEE
AEDPAEGVGTLDADATLAHLRHRLRRLHRQSLRDAERFDQLDDDQRHRTRKRLKRLRYLAEFVAPLLDAGRTARYLDQLRPAQDALGLFNDQVTARRLYEQAAEQDAHAWFAIGWLAAQQPRTAKKAGKALRRLADAPKFWKGRRKG